jgi:hypothetical protein
VNHDGLMGADRYCTYLVIENSNSVDVGVEQGSRWHRMSRAFAAVAYQRRGRHRDTSAAIRLSSTKRDQARRAVWRFALYLGPYLCIHL